MPRDKKTKRAASSRILAARVPPDIAAAFDKYVAQLKEDESTALRMLLRKSLKDLIEE